jgi:predicted RNase H-like HicB family nuclease/predicted RNA binding protein YcfA (HicA-like mRNA interferase family)
MLTNSRDIIRRLKREGWRLDRISGSHHVFKNPKKVPQPSCRIPRKTSAPAWFSRSIGMRAGRRTDRVAHYVAIVEEEEGKAVGVWFPDLPGCFSAGDTLDEAMLNAREALALYADALREDGRSMPRARTLTELKAEAEAAADIESYMVALIPFGPGALRPAAE